MRKIFISRDLQPESIFKVELEKAGYEVWGVSLLEFELVPFGKIPDVDWIFFYSQKGVQSFFNHIQNNPPSPQGGHIHLDKKIKLAGFGRKTASRIEAFGWRCDFVGDGKAKTTATAFLKKAKGQKVLFPRAKESMRSVQQLIDHQIITKDLIIYNNFPKKDFEIPPMDILVFTSPMNAKVYFEKYSFGEGQKIFSIGKTTASTLRKIGIEKVIFPENPSEKNLVNLILKNIQ